MITRPFFVVEGLNNIRPYGNPTGVNRVRRPWLFETLEDHVPLCALTGQSKFMPRANSWLPTRGKRQMWKAFEEKRSCKYSPPHWILSRGKQVSSYSWKYMPLLSREQSTVCALHDFGLTNKSAEWNVVLEGFKQLWTSNAVYACWIAVWLACTASAPVCFFCILSLPAANVTCPRRL